MPTRRKAAKKPRKAKLSPKKVEEEKALEPEVLAAEEPEPLPEDEARRVV